MWLLLAFFIIVKLLVFHKMQKMHVDMHHKKICPNGYNGLSPDPFDCNAYYLCPDTVHLFCPPNMQFDIDAYECTNIDYPNGCVKKLTRNLLL
ncbi:ChtB1 [Ectropis obliqua nucleopolyhedrovirus]|uniref:ChtB1 n=1 Tax=Ectropis obliqua nucleopolyhedrovirus TaxID=59376 RepID=A0EYR1_9ABAC|nr:ChtB1 [Ectropis obliqua nucleopolyhedrovirus]ABI35692.1 ChtB1 [Ectropis obliqua nucleopolyhedrovirus]QWV59594.1 ChtB1 [Ectropis obliqua nucleopolyhedrovirus]UYO72800.1 ChtB1 [Ectropis obliqua nucleopolyhedrovirus]